MSDELEKERVLQIIERDLKIDSVEGIECTIIECVCGEEDLTELEKGRAAAEEFYNNGWYSTETGVALCPDCKPDEEEDEDAEEEKLEDELATLEAKKMLGEKLTSTEKKRIKELKKL